MAGTSHRPYRKPHLLPPPLPPLALLGKQQIAGYLSKVA
jgi:hypothetical protein